MNATKPVMLILMLSAAALSGCADELNDQQATVDAPGPDPDAAEVAQPGANTSPADSNAPPTTIEYGELLVDNEAPDFTATGLDGEPLTLSDYRGEQHVVLVFSRANW